MAALSVSLSLDRLLVSSELGNSSHGGGWASTFALRCSRRCSLHSLLLRRLFTLRLPPFSVCSRRRLPSASLAPLWNRFPIHRKRASCSSPVAYSFAALTASPSWDRETIPGCARDWLFEGVSVLRLDLSCWLDSVIGRCACRRRAAPIVVAAAVVAYSGYALRALKSSLFLHHVHGLG